MKSLACLLAAPWALATSLSAQGFLMKEGPVGFDTLIYFYTGALEITGGTVSDSPDGTPTATAGDVVAFDYKLADGPGQWVDRIYDIEFRSVTYQLRDPARAADPWNVEPAETFLGSALSSEAATNAWFDPATATEGGLSFRVSYGSHAYAFANEYYVLNMEVGDSGFELDPTSTSFYETVIAGLLSGETVTIEVSPEPHFSGTGIVSPYVFDFQEFNVGTELFIPEGAITVIPEPAAAAGLLALAIGFSATIRRRRFTTCA